MKQSRARFTYANVVATLALIGVVVGGGGAAYALGKNTVGSPQIKNGQVKTVDLGKNAVTTKKIKKNAVLGAKVKDASLSTKDLNAKAVAGLNIAGAKVDTGGNVVSWFNRNGAAPTITKIDVGEYRLVFPGNAPTVKAIVQATSWHNDGRCAAGQTPVNGKSGFFVHCFSASTDAPADRQFHFTYVY